MLCLRLLDPRGTLRSDRKRRLPAAPRPRQRTQLQSGEQGTTQLVAMAHCVQGCRQRRAPPPPCPACLHRKSKGPRPSPDNTPTACHHVCPGCSFENTDILSDLLQQRTERGSQSRPVAHSSKVSVLPHPRSPKSRFALRRPQRTLTWGGVPRSRALWRVPRRSEP